MREQWQMITDEWCVMTDEGLELCDEWGERGNELWDSDERRVCIVLSCRIIVVYFLDIEIQVLSAFLS